jgi:hypothetical protein
MTTTTVSTAGGALPKIDRGALMRRAWAIFRETYNYPRIKFTDIGRKCFAWALRKAWAEIREAARLPATRAGLRKQTLSAASASL